jgi:uncharacterized membrane protein
MVQNSKKVRNKKEDLQGNNLMIFLILLISLKAQAITTYEKDALPIFKNRCSMCHNSAMMPDKNWLDYDIAKNKSDIILKRAWINKDMPPGNSTGITDQERETLKNWVNDGAQK